MFNAPNQEDTFRIASWRMEGFLYKIEKLNRKAKKLSVESIRIEILAEITEFVVVKDLDGRPSLDIDGKVIRKAKIYQILTVHGETPKIPGWNFIGTVQHIDGENFVNGEVPEEYRTASAKCDHCGKVRKRNNTYIVRSTEDGNVIQVGRSCLKDFIGHRDPKSIAFGCELIFSVIKMGQDYEESDYYEGGGYPEAFDVQDVLRCAARLTLDGGYVSRAAAEDAMTHSTADMVWQAFTNSKFKSFPPKKATDEEVATLVQTTMDYIAELAVKIDTSDYEHNLVSAFSLGYAIYRTIGLISSAPAAADRTLNWKKEAETKRPSSVHVGEIKERKIFTATLIKKSGYSGNFGWIDILRFSQEDGVILVWFASNGPEDIEVDKEYVFKGTVKKHDEFNGTKNTIITRVVFQ